MGSSKLWGGIMEPIKFDGFNVIYAENQTEYLPLPCYKTKNGTLTICWKLSFKERIKILFTGKVWQRIKTFNKPVQPQLMSVNKIK